jgi:hypothetical protein
MRFHIAPTDEILAFLRLGLTRARPVYRSAQFPDHAPRIGIHNALAAPLANAAGEVVMLVVGAVVTRAPSGATQALRLEVL